MYCPRLNHFVRLNYNGTVSRCGHMVNAPQFDTIEAMDSSTWQSQIEHAMLDDMWPAECRRCEQTESINGTSIRLNAIAFDKEQTLPNYLTVGGVLDNICNSACLTCDEDHSTKIGSLISRQYKIINNTDQFNQLPLDRVVHLDLNGGEPSHSKNYKKILSNLPKNVKSIRLNTNCSTVLEELNNVLAKGIKVTVTVSLDGIGAAHDYIRWPIKWDKFYSNLLKYQSMNLTQLNTWTTVSALNVNNLPEIQQFTSDHNLLHSWALLDDPIPLNVRYENNLTITARDIIPGQVAIDKNNQQELDTFLKTQHRMRNV